MPITSKGPAAAASEPAASPALAGQARSGPDRSGPDSGADSGSNSGSDLPFEQALHKLESIVDAMEAGDLPLETLLAKFEEGTQLVKSCQAKLEEAELKISTLEKNAAGEPQLKPAPDSLLDNE